MEKRRITFDEGDVEFLVNDKTTITFNPTDAGFARRIFNAFEVLEKKQDEYSEELKNADGAKAYALADRMDKEMRETIDGVFGANICDGLFGAKNVYALADGLPLWLNFIVAVFEQIDGALTAETGKTKSRLEKYLAKYRRA